MESIFLVHTDNLGPCENGGFVRRFTEKEGGRTEVKSVRIETQRVFIGKDEDDRNYTLDIEKAASLSQLLLMDMAEKLAFSNSSVVGDPLRKIHAGLVTGPSILGPDRRIKHEEDIGVTVYAEGHFLFFSEEQANTFKSFKDRIVTTQ